MEKKDVERFLLVLLVTFVSVAVFTCLLDIKQKELERIKAQSSEISHQLISVQEQNQQALKDKQNQLDEIQEQLQEVNSKTADAEHENKILRMRLRALMRVKPDVHRESYVLYNRCTNDTPSVDPVAWWKFDEANGSIAADSSGRNFEGKFVNSPQWVKGNPGVALSLDGSSNFVSIPNASYDNLCAGTVSAWVYLNDNADAVIIAKQHDGLNTYGLFSIGITAETGGQLVKGVPGQLYWHSQNIANYASSTGIVNTGTWHNLAVAFDSSHVSFYIDGKLDSTQEGNFFLPTDFSPTLTSIGYWSAGGNKGHYLNGKIQDLRIYNRILSSEEILRIFNKK